ncbi:class I SAM-dependent methyltransferase [Brevundimonas sp. 2R-24]|uniref:Class I SAM-dependent methyltransferase n=1 Tax=Peiella sedimenti TaxID=3061083 RepID=A0ABT8SK34_9CAUL|nr:class I SAM-dependent methyltransferase [Caulobacteraceae bacterium XZ-24]
MAPRIADQPTTLVTRPWEDYALLDSGHGRKLERYGDRRVVRPEPQCLWGPREPALWDAPDAEFDPSDEEDAGRWRFAAPQPDSFPLGWRDVRFHGRFTAFRHLAFFPEQAANWEWLTGRVRTLDQPRVLNLFGYTGVASLAMAAAGARVTHVDASKKAVAWARQNAELSGLAEAPVRWIVEDARKYLTREVKRASQYEGIVLDPPKYGRGPDGDVWRLFEDTPGLIADCVRVLSPDASFLLINAYAARISGLSLAQLLRDALAERGGVVDWGELALAEEGEDGRAIGLSFFARWSAE